MSSFANTVIPYYPALSVKLGSVTSAILLRQLEYWFRKMEYRPFYKFLKPCEHRSYKTGESWTEELGMSEAEFRTAFTKIGIVYKSKKEFDNSQDKFQGKYYCSYIDRLERKTYYFRNHELVRKLDNELNEDYLPRNEETQFLEMKKVDFYKQTNSISRSEETQSPITVDYTEEYQENKTGNVRESILKLKELLETQFNNKLTPTQIDKLVMLSVQYGVNPLEIYNNSDYLRGFVDKKPTWRMWTANAETTIQKMKAGEYVNKEAKTSKSEFIFDQVRFDRIVKLVEVADISALTNKDRDYYNKCQEYLRG